MANASKKKNAVGDEDPTRAAFSPRFLFSSRHEWIPGLILVLAVILVYQPVWRAGLVWDDEAYLIKNPCIVGPFGLREIWTTSAADIFPLTLSTFWAEHALWGFAPLPYHLVTVLLHGACAVMLWRVLRLLQVSGAWLGAALWALHPVMVESVAWITEMKNTESGLFFLLSILFFLRWLGPKDSDGPTGASWSYALTLIFAALAMASKSSTVILPVVLGLCAWWREGRWPWRHVKSLTPIFLMSITAGLISIWTQHLQLTIDPEPQTGRSWPARLATAGDAVWFYLGKLLWPHPLVTVYRRWEINAHQLSSYVPLLAVISVLFILWDKRESWSRAWFFVFAYFLIALLPALGLVDNYIFRFSLVFDHLQYLAGMGPLALAGAGAIRLAERIFPKGPGLQLGLYAGLLLVLGTLSWQRTHIFENEETLWSNTLAHNPDCVPAHCNLGTALLEKGQVDEAMAHYRKALEINPSSVGALSGLGAALLNKGQVDEAITQLRKALAIDPNFSNAHYNLGNALFQKGLVDQAISQYQETLEAEPGFSTARYNLGAALIQKGRLDEAIDQFQLVLETNPNQADAHYNLGNALLQRGRVDEAMAQYRMALGIDPSHAEAHFNFGMALIQKGQLNEAVAHLEKAVEYDPNYADAHNNLGNIMLLENHLDDAIVQYQRALEIDPSSAQAHCNLGSALFKKGQMGEATAQFQESLRLKPDLREAQNNLARVQALQKGAPLQK